MRESHSRHWLFNWWISKKARFFAKLYFRYFTTASSFPFCLRIGSPAQIDLNVQGVCINPESLCEEDVPVVLRNGHDPVLVIDQLPGVVLPEGIFIPGVGQDHGKAGNLDLFAALSFECNRPHVHLCLPNGRRNYFSCSAWI